MMNMEFEKKFDELLEKEKREIQKPNLLVVGGTGVGKSSLLNKFIGIFFTGYRSTANRKFRFAVDI